MLMGPVGYRKSAEKYEYRPEQSLCLRQEELINQVNLEPTESKTSAGSRVNLVLR